MRRLSTRFLAAVGVCAVLAVAGTQGAGARSAAVASTRAATDGCVDESGCFVVLEVVGLIDPITIDYVDGWLRTAEDTPGVRGVVLQLDSHGTTVSDAEFSDFVERIVESEVPVTIWVGETGASALGGAAELVLAVDDSSMSYASRIGRIGSQRVDPQLVGDLSERFPDLIDGDVSADTALDRGWIDRSNPVLVDALGETEGFETRVETADDGRRVRVPESVPTFVKLSLVDGLLHTVASAPVAYLLLAVALGLLIFEFFTAGVGVAGMIGAGAGLLAGFGLGVLPTRPWALALCLVAAVAFSIDVQTGLPRAWMFIGSVLWAVGSVWLIEGGTPWPALLTGILGMLVGMISGMPSMVRARFGTPTVGREFMLERRGVAETSIDPTGVVLVDGARWRARTNRLTPLAAGDAIVVGGLDGLELQVEPVEGAAVDYRELRRREPAGSDDDGAAVDVPTD